MFFFLFSFLFPGSVALIFVSGRAHGEGQAVDGEGEHDGGALLGRDRVQGLQVSQLQSRLALLQDQGGLLQVLRSLLLSLGSHDLSSGLSGSLGFGSHGSLELNWHPHVLNFDPLYLDPPGSGGLVEDVLHDVADGLALGEDLGQGLGAKHVA